MTGFRRYDRASFVFLTEDLLGRFLCLLDCSKFSSSSGFPPLDHPRQGKIQERAAPFRVAAHRWKNVSLALSEIFSPCTHLVLNSDIAVNRINSSHPLKAAAAYLSGFWTAVATSSAASASASSARRTYSYPSPFHPSICFKSYPTPQS